MDAERRELNERMRWIVDLIDPLVKGIPR